MKHLKEIIQHNKKECIAALIFVVCLGIFSVSYAFAAVEPVRSIVIKSENTDFASGEEGSWQVTDMRQMFRDCRSLTNLDMRNATFNATSYSSMFYNVANGINIIVKDETAKIWIETRLSDAGKAGTVTIAST